MNKLQNLMKSIASCIEEAEDCILEYPEYTDWLVQAKELLEEADSSVYHAYMDQGDV